MVESLEEREEKIKLSLGTEKIRTQHLAGKLTARERIERLLDKDSFFEINMFVKHRSTNFGMEDKELPADGVVTGYGRIDGRLVFVFSQDFMVMGGSIGEMHAKKICNIIDQALKNNAPLIGLYDSGGARVQEGIDALSGCGQIFYRNVMASGKIPQISAIMGSCAGAAAYSPALTDFIFMVKNTSSMFLTGPQIIKTYTGEDVSPQALGGADIHSRISGVADFVTENDEECLQKIRELLSFLSSSDYIDNSLDCGLDIDSVEICSEINADLSRCKKVYDIKKLIALVVDNKYFLELKPEYATNIVTGFSRIGGHRVGIVANQPKVLAGSLTADSSDKAARFIQFCDAFDIPIVTFVDVPGFLPGIKQEHQGVVKHGAKMLLAYSGATVPKITIIVRKAYGGAFLAMCSRDLGADLVFALPTVEIAVVGPEGALDIMFKGKEAEIKQHILKEYRENFTSPYFAASRGHVDAIIELDQIRSRLIDSLRVLSNKKDERAKKKHSLSI